MPSRAQKIETLLGEYRIVVPALGAIFGFQLTLAFQAGFETLPQAAKLADLVGMLATAAALVLLVVPAGYHRFTARVDESEAFLRFAQRTIGAALVFVTFGITLAVYVQAAKVLPGPWEPVAVAACVLAFCGTMWWLLPSAKARRLQP